jgi:endonuclease III
MSGLRWVVPASRAYDLAHVREPAPFVRGASSDSGETYTVCHRDCLRNGFRLKLRRLAPGYYAQKSIAGFRQRSNLATCLRVGLALYNLVVDPVKRRARRVYRRLLATYGEPVWRTPLPPLDELISTILSQNTNDLNRDRAYQALRRKFPAWEDVRDARATSVIGAIRSAGLANQKGPRIQAALRSITRERGALDLAFLRSYPPDDARAWLTGLKGVGPKTAAIVMQFSLGMPAFPVDTHIYRVTGRLGLRPARLSVEKTHDLLASLFPPDTYGPAHLNLIRLGRDICHARKPACDRCPLNELCPYGQARLKANTQDG